MLKVILSKYVDQQVELAVYSSKSRTVRGEPSFLLVKGGRPLCCYGSVRAAKFRLLPTFL